MSTILRNDLRELVLKGTCNAELAVKANAANLAKYIKRKAYSDSFACLKSLANGQIDTTLTTMIKNGVLSGEQAFQILDTYGRVFETTMHEFYAYCSKTCAKPDYVFPVLRVGRLIHADSLSWTFKVYNSPIRGAVRQKLYNSPEFSDFANTHLDLFVVSILDDLQNESLDTTATVHLNFGGLADNPDVETVSTLNLALFLSTHIVKSVYPNCSVVAKYLDKNECQLALDRKIETKHALSMYTTLKKTSKPISAYIQTEREYAQFDRNMIDCIQRGVMSGEKAFEAFKAFHEASVEVYKDCSYLDNPKDTERCVFPLVRLGRTADRTTVFAHGFNGLDIPDYIEFDTPEYWERFNIWKEYDERPDTALYTFQQVALFVESALAQLQGCNPDDTRKLYIDIVGLPSSQHFNSVGMSNLFNAAMAAVEIVKAVYPNCSITPSVHGISNC